MVLHRLTPREGVTKMARQWSPTAAGGRAAKLIKRLLRWQLCAALPVMIAGGWWAGTAGAISALLGILTNIAAGWAYAAMIARSRSRTAVDTLRTLLRAEAVKIILVVLQLWLVLAQYRDVVPAAFIASFILGALMFPLVLTIREEPDFE